MPKKKKLDALSILPGDSLRVFVPPGASRTLEPGRYELVVAKTLAAKPDGRYYQVTYHDRRSVVSLTVMIPTAPRLEDWLFLGRDEHPVPYIHNQNLASRLRMSLEDNARR